MVGPIITVIKAKTIKLEYTATFMIPKFFPMVAPARIKLSLVLLMKPIAKLSFLVNLKRQAIKLVPTTLLPNPNNNITSKNHRFEEFCKRLGRSIVAPTIIKKNGVKKP